jgi:F-type H+-transporting ATPase subunit b
MSIDWFTVIAQIINFFILVFLMKLFLYKPIRKAFDTREKRIAMEIEDANAKKAEAKVERDEFIKKNKDFDYQYADQLSKAREEVKVERERLLDEARKKADDMSAKRQELLINDAHNLTKSISLRTQQEVFAIARKTLTDLGTVSLEEGLCDVFVRRLSEVDGKEKEVISDALKTTPEPALLRTAFDLPEKQRVKIQNKINETFEAEISIRFMTSPDLISGIELTSNGYKIAWNISDYLVSMEKGLGESLKKSEETETKFKGDMPEKRSH